MRRRCRSNFPAMIRPAFVALVALAVLSVCGLSTSRAADLALELRSRVELKPKSGLFTPHVETAAFDPRETAIVVCDMWDDHWCKASAKRVAEMAPRMNDVLKVARQRGVLIIHCPSDCMEFYKDTPQRKRAQAAPVVETKIPLQRWCKLDPAHEPPLPIDDSQGGCDSGDPQSRPWKRQIASLEIHEPDAITDSAEAYYLMHARGIKNVIVMGVHTNMCVLGRPFSIRQLTYQGLRTVLMRDLTDTMYDPQARPYCSHFTGTDLVVEHIEKYWCPTTTSTSILGEPEYRYPGDTRKELAIICAEDEYETLRTLPAFAAQHLGGDFRTSLVGESKDDPNRLVGLEALAKADVLLLSVRRRAFPAEQLGAIRKYIDSGKPIVAIRTSSHAFALRDKAPPEGRAVWPEFDREILGAHYTGHLGKQKEGPSSIIYRAKTAAEHPLLVGVPEGEIGVRSWLYKSSPLAESATPLLMGREVHGKAPAEPVAWTFQTKSGSRVFYTSLGHADEFALPAFRRLLQNAVYAAAGIDVPAAVAARAAE